MKRKLVTVQKRNKRWIWRVISDSKKKLPFVTVHALSGYDYATPGNAVRGFRSFAAHLCDVELPEDKRRR